MSALLDLPALALQTAIVARLETDGITVYDAVSDSSTVDYVVVGDMSINPSEDYGSKQHEAHDCIVNLNCYSVAPGMARVHQLALDVTVSLTTTALAVTGYGVPDWRHVSYNSSREGVEAGSRLRTGALQLQFTVVKT